MAGDLSPNESSRDDCPSRPEQPASNDDERTPTAAAKMVFDMVAFYRPASAGWAGADLSSGGALGTI